MLISSHPCRMMRKLHPNGTAEKIEGKFSGINFCEISDLRSPIFLQSTTPIFLQSTTSSIFSVDPLVSLWAEIRCFDPGFGDGRWLPSQPPFTCQEPRCGNLELPPNALQFVNCSIDAERHAPGTVCEIRCVEGFADLSLIHI